MLQFLKTLVVEDAGQDLIEYALVAALLGVAALSGLRVLSNTVGRTFTGIDNSLSNSVPQGSSGGH